MKSLRAKIILYIAVPTLLVYVAILGGTLMFLRQRSFVELEQNMTRLASSYAGRFDGFMREAQAVAETAGVAMGSVMRLGERAIFEQLRSGIGSRRFIYGAAAAFEPGTVRPPDELFAPYVFRQGGGLVEMNIDRSVYDWYSDPQWTWYQQPKAVNHPVWSAPYFDTGAGNALMTTYSVPFHVNGAFAGVTTVDIDLTHLQKAIGEDITDGADFMILAGDGSFVYDRRSERILNAKLADIARQNGNVELEQLVPMLLRGKPGVARVAGWDETEPQWLFYSPIHSTGWTFVAHVPERVALSGARTRFIAASAALAATLAMIVAAIAIVSRKITEPLSRLSAKVQEISAGNIDARVDDVTGRDEIGRLALAFNGMAARLREHIDRLAEEEASRRKVQHDLNVARDIQRGLLPETAPPLRGYGLAGWSQPADETGGDYYDWQPLPDGSLAITLADVTGHGIGPALVTAVCRAYARASFPSEADMCRVLDRINQLLCEDLRSERFVTFVVAVVNPAANLIRLLSAGHGPLFYYEAATDRMHQYAAHDIPMGLSPEINHGPPTEFQVAPGDALILVTDGFLEWPNDQGELYGSDRLVEAVRRSKGLPAAKMIERIVADVIGFSGGSRQLDDLTAVILKRES